MSLHEEMVAMGQRARVASHEVVLLDARKKNKILMAMADALEAQRAVLKAANDQDMAAGRAAGLSAAMLDRLRLSDARIDAMAKGLREVAGLKDSVGAGISRWIRPNGLESVKVRVPIGVIAILYESRPNVTADAAALCFKSSNAVILRGGKESMQSNKAIADCLREGGRKEGLTEHAIQLVSTTDRDAVRELVQSTKQKNP